MQPIVSPWFIYSLGIVQGIKDMAIAFSVLAGLTLFALSIASIFLWIDEEEDDVKKILKIMKISGTILLICLLLAIFVPSKDTLIAMYVADKLTYNTTEKILETGKDLKQELKKDIIEIIKSITERNDKEKR